MRTKHLDSDPPSPPPSAAPQAAKISGTEPAEFPEPTRAAHSVLPAALRRPLLEPPAPGSAVINGQVLTATGAPLQAEFFLTNARRTAIKRGFTDPRGRFRAEHLPPGIYFVLAESRPRRRFLQRPINLRDGESCEVEVRALGASTSLEVRVEDERGAPLALTLIVSEVSDLVRTTTVSAIPGYDIAFDPRLAGYAISGLPHGDYVICALLTEVERCDRIAIQRDGTTRHRMVVKEPQP